MTAPSGWWTPELLERVIALRAQGMTITQITEALGAPTRNVIMGKLNRLGLIGSERTKAEKAAKAERGEPPRRRVRAKIHARPARKAADGVLMPAGIRQPAVREPVLAAFPEAVPILDLAPDSCRYPVATLNAGEVVTLQGATRGGLHLFCGKPVVTGRRYCAEHVERVYQPVKSTARLPLAPQRRGR